MSDPEPIRTERLILRQWRPEDRAPFAALNGDPVAMKHFPALRNRAQSDELADRIESRLDENGWGLWAVEVVDGPQFIGFIGLMDVGFNEHFTPATEVGWRIAAQHWGNGYATEGARAALSYGLNILKRDEIVSFTIPANEPSWRVMERIGMTRDLDGDFNHPSLTPGHPMERHILYRVRAD